MGKIISRIYFRKLEPLLGDCQTSLDKSTVKPEELLETLNLEIPFLDILIKRENSGIWMNLYHKPTDTH